MLALDLAPGMVDDLRADAERNGLPQVTCRVGDAEDPDVEPVVTLTGTEPRS